MGSCTKGLKIRGVSSKLGQPSGSCWESFSARSPFSIPPAFTGLGLDQTGLGGILLLVITLVILFILGVFLGDLVEETIKG